MATSSPADNGGDSLFQTDFPPEEFAERRAKIFEAIGNDAHALLQGAPPVRGFEIFRQSNQFYYCCGVEVPQAYLLLAGEGRRATLYLVLLPLMMTLLLSVYLNLNLG